MIIKNIDGNLITSDCKCIVHSVNCLGRMGAGTAKDIRNKYPEVYESYKKLCNMSKPQELLGGIQIIQSNDKQRHIINLFGQLKYGYEEQYTDYNAFENGLNHIKNYCQLNNIIEIGFPYKIGCNLGGGNWEVILKLIEKIFDDMENLTIKIYKI